MEINCNQWSFGKVSSGEDVQAFRLDNSSGANAVIIEFGASLQSLCVPSRSGNMTDVVLGYDTAEQYETLGEYLGAVVGRVANRIGDARFALNGKVYNLAANSGPNCLHGGAVGFGRLVWRGERLSSSSVRFTHFSSDMEDGFPGNMTVSATYTLDDKNQLHIEYDAVSDADTPFGITNHAYFDMSGSGKAMEQILQINADSILENDENTLPTGRFLPVEGTPFDFRSPKCIKIGLQYDNIQLKLAGGYDHNYCLNGNHAATLSSDETGIVMDVYTDRPGMQLYTSNFLTSRPGKYGTTMGPRGSVCLETQNYPNAINCPRFPNCVLKAGESMHSETIYAFHTEGAV